VAGSSQCGDSHAPGMDRARGQSQGASGWDRHRAADCAAPRHATPRSSAEPNPLPPADELCVAALRSVPRLTRAGGVRARGSACCCSRPLTRREAPRRSRPPPCAPHQETRGASARALRSFKRFERKCNHLPSLFQDCCLRY